MSTPLVDAHRSDMVYLYGLADTDLLSEWQQFGDPKSTVDGLIKVLPDLVTTYGSAASSLAVDWYAEMRDAAHVTGRFQAIPAVLPDLARTESLAQWASNPLFLADVPDIEAAQSKVAGGLQRIIANADRETIIGSVAADPKPARWMRVGSDSACDWCRMLIGRGAKYRSEGTASFKSHDRCVLPGTIVTSGTVEAGFRRWYEGEVIILRTASGDELSITPNHPVLTDRGWVEAGLLREGDDVVQRSGADLKTLQVPHEDDVPARIEDVWRTHSVNGLARMPVAAEDFHGDGAGTQGDVEVVTPDRFLSHVLNAKVRQLSAQPVRSGAGTSSVLVSLFALGDQRNSFVGAGRSTHGGVRGSSLGPLLLGREGGLVQQVGGSYSAALNPGVYKPSRDYVPADTERVRDGVLGLTKDVALRQLLQVRARDSIVGRTTSRRTRFDPPLVKDEAERLRIHLDLGRSLTERLSGGVKLSGVSDLRRINYSGHVYNLQTQEGWFAASSVVVSNCHCSAAPGW